MVKNSTTRTKKEKGECRYCHKKGHWERECRKKKADEGKGKERANVAEDKAEYAFAIRDSPFSCSDWIADSGAESHIISDHSLFISYTPTPGHCVNGIGGDTSIEGRGDVRVSISNGTQTTTITLRNCAHVPSFTGNLLSIKAIDRAGGSAIFKGGRATIFGPDGKELGVGHQMENGGLYRMDMEGLLVKEQAHAVRGDASGAKTWQEWHRIFGHLNQAALEHLHSKNLVDGMKVVASSPRNYFCEACVKVKHHMAPFPPESTTKYEVIGDLTVADVWGPAHTTSLQGNRYFVSFTDAYSRFTMVAFMKSMSKVLEHYKAYKAMIETQHGRKLKHIQTDNGKEFINAAVRAHAVQ